MPGSTSSIATCTLVPSADGPRMSLTCPSRTAVLALLLLSITLIMSVLACRAEGKGPFYDTADGLERVVGLNLPRPQQRGFDVRHDIVRADVLHELGLVEEGRGLLPRAAQNQHPARFPQALVQLFQRMQPGGIDRGHVPQPQDHDGGEGRQVGGDVGELVGHAEEKRARGSAGW